jgi:hypothetical protein
MSELDQLLFTLTLSAENMYHLVTINAANVTVHGRLPEALRYGSGLKALMLFYSYLLTSDIRVKIKFS